MLEIGLLGRFWIRLNGQIVELPSRPAQSLFAYLVLRAGTSHRREKLAGLMWPEATEVNARAYLRQSLWRIRRALQENDDSSQSAADCIAADDLTIGFVPPAAYWFDVAELEREATGDSSVDALVRSVSAYQGEFLPGFYSEWEDLERERLRAVFETKMGALLERLVAERRWPSILEWGERWIALGHVPEPAYRALMQAHHGLGDQSSMAGVFQRCKEAMQRELGVETSEQTRALYDALARRVAPGELVSSRPERGISLTERKRLSASAPQSRPPRPLTSFIGRERENAEVKRLTTGSDSRLVTLTGVGGCGKTRLALHVCQDLLTQNPHGVWFVELASLTDPTLVPQTVAATIGLLEDPGRPILAVLTDHLQSQEAVLILDNCEHLVEACAKLAETLLSACPHLRILASSREALGIAGETVFQVPSLSTPASSQAISVEEALQYDAVCLFIDRAKTAQPGFRLTAENVPAVTQICRRLDGMPLAIELAAARVKMLTPEQIAVRLGDRFRLLTGGSRTALPRQQTLRATIDWSYNLLSEAERILLSRLSVFAGGWTLEAAEEVCGQQNGDKAQPLDVLDLLTQLVNKSLVAAEHVPDETARYRLLETLRHYAREKLLEMGDGSTVRDRHLAYFHSLAESAEPELTGPAQVAWLNSLDIELDNVRVALEWALENGVEAGLRLATRLWRFWEARDRSREGSEWLARLLQQPEAMRYPQARARALGAQAMMLVTPGHLAEAQAAAEASLGLCRTQGDQVGEAYALMAVGVVSSLHGDVALARPHLDESLRLFRELGDKVGQADALSWLCLDHRDSRLARAWLEESLAINRELGHLAGIGGCVLSLAQLAYWEGDYVTPVAWLEEARALQGQLGSKSGQAWVMQNYGNLEFRRGDYERARAYYLESIALAEAGGQRDYWCAVNLAHIAARQGQLKEAHAMFDESIRRFYAARITNGVAYGLEGLVSLAVVENQPERAARLLGWADAIRETIGDSRPAVEQTAVDGDVAAIRAHLDGATFAAAYAAGRSMTTEQAIAYALEPRSS